VTMQLESREAMKVTLDYDGPVQAPVAENQRIGTLRVTAPEFPGVEAPVYAAEPVSGTGFFGRIAAGLHALVFGPPAAK